MIEFAAGLVLGVFLGMIVFWREVEHILEEQNECIRVWHRRAMDYLELWQKERSEKRRSEKDTDKDKADWWKE